ncbi:MAG: amidase family protein [Vicinamibacterales bacterium]
MASAFNAALDAYAAAGATLVDVELPYASAAIPVYYLVATAEASSNLARYDGVRCRFRAPAEGGPGAMDDLRTMYGRTRGMGFGAEVKRRIMLGTYVLSAGYYDAYYLKAQQVRTLIQRDYQHAFEQVDVVAMPTSPTAAFKIGERTADPLQMYLADIFTVSANLAGLPAVSVPCGFTPEGLPVGLQLTGRMFDEATLLGAAFATNRPPIGGHARRRSKHIRSGRAIVRLELLPSSFNLARTLLPPVAPGDETLDSRRNERSRLRERAFRDAPPFLTSVKNVWRQRPATASAVSCRRAAFASGDTLPACGAVSVEYPRVNARG